MRKPGTENGLALMPAPKVWNSARWMAGLATLALSSFFIGISPCQAQADNPGTTPPPMAQQPDTAGSSVTQTATEEPQNVRVVRLSDVEGMVQIERGNEVQFSQAVMNMPLIQGSRINTGADGRAEVEFEDGSVVRITPNSSFVLSRMETTADGNLKTATEQLAGLIYYELRSDSRSSFHVMLGDRTITPMVNSTFRVNMAAATPNVSVIDGRVQVQGASDSYLAEVRQGEAIEFPSSGNEKYTIANGILPNGFDEWNDQRDQEAQQQAQNQTPAREQGGGSIMDGGLGWSDLDSYGGWYPLPGYGMVWQPYGVGADFDPYGDGMWANFGGAFGYTWVSGYPWGWLPFHCGGWSYIGSFGWGWMPGAYGCGGFGIGYGWYGYRFGRGYRYPHTNIYGAPSGYRAPAPPNIVRGQTPPRIVHVGNGPALAGSSLRSGHGNNSHMARFNGQKIEPLHSMMAGAHVPMRNAALYNNYPARAYQGNVHDALLNHATGEVHGPGFTHSGNAGPTHTGRPGFTHTGSGQGVHGPISAERSSQAHPGGPGGMFRSPMSANRTQAFNAARGEQFGQRSFGAGNHTGSFGAGNRAGFGQQTSFGPRGGFNNAHFSGSGGGYRGGGGFHGNGAMMGGGYHGGAGGYHGGGAAGGFHGAGASGGGHMGGGMSSGGGGHAGGSGGGMGGGMAGGGGSHGGGGMSGGGGGHSGR